MMKKILFILFIALGLTSIAQNRIPNTNVAYGFPNGGWKYLKTIDVDKETNIYLYYYSGSTVLDSENDTIIPHMKIYVRKNYTDELFNLVYERYEYNPFQTLEEYTEGLPADGGIGYKGIYESPQDGKEYLFDMIYFKDKNTVIEIRLETTKDTYKDFQEEFETILKTVKITN